MKDPYDILGVTRHATQDQIKKAYRTLARERHPDRDRDNPWAEEDFKDISAAYRLLSDADARARFDLGGVEPLGARRRTAGPGKRSAHRSARSFEEGLGTRTGKGHRPVKIDGADVTYDVEIDFLAAVHGTMRSVAMTNGKHLKVSVPAGTRDEQVLRLKGQGMPGFGGGADGDALVTTRVPSHPVFRREGNDVHSEVSVTMQEAVLGGRIETPTVDGPVVLTVPAESNTGTVLRLKGKGIRAGPRRGDHLATLKVVLPPKSDKEFQDFVQRWGPAHPYGVRSENADVD